MKNILIILTFSILVSCGTTQPTQISSAVIKADSANATREAKDLFNLGMKNVDAKDYSSALINLTKAIDLSPNFATALYTRGLVKAQLNQAESAITDLNRAGELGITQAFDLVTKIRRRQALNQMIINN